MQKRYIKIFAKFHTAERWNENENIYLSGCVVNYYYFVFPRTESKTFIKFINYVLLHLLMKKILMGYHYLNWITNYNGKLFIFKNLKQRLLCDKMSCLWLFTKTTLILDRAKTHYLSFNIPFTVLFIAPYKFLLV